MLITSSPQRMPDNATYIKLLSSQRAAGVFMRYFTLYGARGGHTNPAPLPFRVAKAEPCMQTAGIETRQRRGKWLAVGGLGAKKGSEKHCSPTINAEGSERIGNDFS